MDRCRVVGCVGIHVLRFGLAESQVRWGLEGACCGACVFVVVVRLGGRTGLGRRWHVRVAAVAWPRGLGPEGRRRPRGGGFGGWLECRDSLWILWCRYRVVGFSDSGLGGGVHLKCSFSGGPAGGWWLAWWCWESLYAVADVACLFQVLRAD